MWLLQNDKFPLEWVYPEGKVSGNRLVAVLYYIGNWCVGSSDLYLRFGYVLPRSWKAGSLSKLLQVCL